MERERVRRVALVAVAVVVVAGVVLGTYQATGGGGSSSRPDSTKPPSQIQLISVSGNQLIQNGEPVRLVGVNIGASGYYCLGNHNQPFAVPVDSASISALMSWHVNAVRILVNQQCWLGLDGEPHVVTSAAYRTGIESFISMLNAVHIEVVLGLYSNTPITYSANGKHQATSSTFPMADGAHSEDLWTSVATAFRSYPGVMFDLYGEPHQIPWACWKSGCVIGGQPYVGMQQLVDAVRQTGARQPLLLGGVDYSSDLSHWLEYEPTDPLHQLVASAHIYSFNPCTSAVCWNNDLASLARTVPVVTGEFGGTGCSPALTKRYMKWADKHLVSYIAWAWLPGSCAVDGPLISSYSGAATTYGSVVQAHLAALFQAGSRNVGSISAATTVSGKGSKKNT